MKPAIEATLRKKFKRQYIATDANGQEWSVSKSPVYWTEKDTRRWKAFGEYPNGSRCIIKARTRRKLLKKIEQAAKHPTEDNE